jgi:hypothetical protein
LIFNLYFLIEALFFFWFLGRITPSDSIKKIAKTFFYLSLPLWILFVFALPLMKKDVSGGGAFAAMYYIIVSFLAGFALLHHVEKEKSILSSSSFWFTLGIFFLQLLHILHHDFSLQPNIVSEQHFQYHFI